MDLTTLSHPLMPVNPEFRTPDQNIHATVSPKILNKPYLLTYSGTSGSTWSIKESTQFGLLSRAHGEPVDPRDFFSELKKRLFTSPYQVYREGFKTQYLDLLKPAFQPYLTDGLEQGMFARLYSYAGLELKASLDHGLPAVDRASPDKLVFDEGPASSVSLDPEPVDVGPEDVEIVIVRPNIEHYMLGIILGLGGSELGNTLWGQTELSCYDDSMHGVWGMSYKYHERAIVFNEKNLIRLWDIAYDAYNGGKDDTYVDWLRRDARNGYAQFQTSTMEVSKNYRGPSMMVMAFAHPKGRARDEHLRRNWPSPIVYYDKGHPGQPLALPVDSENIQVVDVEEFRVFNNPLYQTAMASYMAHMPDFMDLHRMRKTAGHSSVESEAASDCLAFQGSMRVKKNGMLLQEIHGSGHHGPDYVGVASVRAGKGTKSQPAAPSLYRMV